ncbi:MAG: SDR family NAD(P)-dependent oxidoreductase [Fimbriimonadaceae bacterium]
MLVTGASSGIGRESARLLAEAGCELVIGARRVGLLEELAAELCDLGAPHVLPIRVDVSNLDEVRAFVAEARKAAGDARPALVNVAGLAEFGPFHEQSTESLLAQVQVNLVGPMLACRDVVPWMLEAGGGDIVNVLSITSELVFAGTGAYSAAKSGLRMLGRVLAAEYRKKGVRVTSILPGAVDTPIWEGKSFVPPRKDMLPVGAVAQAIADVVLAPLDRSYDEITIMPPKGVL